MNSRENGLQSRDNALEKKRGERVYHHPNAPETYTAEKEPVSMSFGGHYTDSHDVCKRASRGALACV